MATTAPIPDDSLAALVNPDSQKLAARMAQDVFAGVFRQSVTADGASDQGVLAEVGARCFNWCQAAGSEDGKALRLALLISGLDQWGLAYAQTFKLQAIPALTALVGSLRTRLDAQADSRFQTFYAEIDTVEAAAIDFKIELRRSIHLALWHAMAACETAEEVAAIVQPLGSLMLALEQRMPVIGWRLLADALAHIQVGLLADASAVSTVAQEGTQQLFASLAHALPSARYQAILAHAGKVVIAWQQAARPEGNP